MSEVVAKAVPDKLTVLPTFEQNKPAEVRVINKGDNAVQGRLRIMFPQDVEWKIGKGDPEQGEYKATFKIPPDTRRKLEIHVQAVGHEPRKSSMMVDLETRKDTVIDGKIIQLELRPDGQIE